MSEKSGKSRGEYEKQRRKQIMTLFKPLFQFAGSAKVRHLTLGVKFNL